MMITIYKKVNIIAMVIVLMNMNWIFDSRTALTHEGKNIIIIIINITIVIINIRVRDEFRLTLHAAETLYESSIAFGNRSDRLTWIMVMMMRMMMTMINNADDYEDHDEDHDDVDNGDDDEDDDDNDIEGKRSRLSREEQRERLMQNSLR